MIVRWAATTLAPIPSSLWTIPLHSSRGGVAVRITEMVHSLSNQLSLSMVLSYYSAYSVVDNSIRACKALHPSEGPYRYEDIPLEGHPCTCPSFHKAVRHFPSFVMISPVGQYIWTLSHSFAWLRLGIGYRAYALIFRFCRMVGHHDFLMQSLLRPHDLISPLWWSGVETLVDNQPAVTQPLLLGSGFDVHPYRRINYLYHAAGRIPWWFCLANPSTFTECRLFTW